MRKIIIGALGVVLAAGSTAAAHADGDIPGGKATKATVQVAASKFVRGVFERAGDADWYRVRLQGGQAYAVSGYATAEGTSAVLSFRDAGGRVLTSATTDDTVQGGAEFLAPRDGTYFVSVEDGRTQDAGAYPHSYSLTVSPDCAGDKETTCKTKVGAVRDAFLAWASDEDWYAASLTGGRRYRLGLRLTGEGGNPDCTLLVLDARGRDVAPHAGPGTLAFTPPASGTYYLAVRGENDFGGGYVLSLD